MILPFLDSVRATIDLREQITQIEPQPVITRDNVTMEVDAVIYYVIADPVRATYEVQNLKWGIEQLTLSGLRNVIGALDLDHTLTSRDTINTQLRAALDAATQQWGVKVMRVELKNIDPPQEIKLTMEKQMTAERARRATVTQAEGEKSSAILRAEGQKQSQIVSAEGQKRVCDPRRRRAGAGPPARRDGRGAGDRARREGDRRRRQPGAVPDRAALPRVPHADRRRLFEDRLHAVRGRGRHGLDREHEGALRRDGDGRPPRFAPSTAALRRTTPPAPCGRAGRRRSPRRPPRRRA